MSEVMIIKITLYIAVPLAIAVGIALGYDWGKSKGYENGFKKAEDIMTRAQKNSSKSGLTQIIYDFETEAIAMRAAGAYDEADRKYHIAELLRELEALREFTKEKEKTTKN